MSKSKKAKIKSSKEIIELFNDSDDDIDSLGMGKEACINYTTDFDKWTVHHYYAIKKREKYPNMFFYYFPRSLFRPSKMSEKDKAKIVDYIFNNKEKNINGKWGYLSLLLDNPNICGAELFTTICNNRVIIDLSNSFPLKEDAECDFDEDINNKVENILESKRELYNNVLADFENYLNEQMTEAAKKKYYNFVKNHEERYIYCDKNKNLNELIDGLFELKNEKENNNGDVDEDDNILLLPIDYNEKKEKKNKVEEKNDDIIMKDSKKTKNSTNLVNKDKKSKKRKIKKKYKLYKCDFDLEFYEENNISSIIELEEEKNNDDYNIINTNGSHTNKRNKNIILDEDDIISINPNEINETNESGNNENIKLNKKSKRRKLKKKETSLNSKIKYSEDKDNNKENFKNINYSTNLSSNNNLLESNSNINNHTINNNHIFTPMKQNKENNKNNISEFDFNKENVEFYENEQNYNGYISDFTKKVYYGNEINNKILVFSDNEDEIYLRKLAPKKKKKKKMMN